MTSPIGSAPQGRDTVDVDAPAELLWELLADSRELTSWGPPVKSVEVIGDTVEPERVGTPRKVEAQFGRKAGHFVEHRVRHVQGRMVAYAIDKDDFGLARFMARPGFSFELERLGTTKTRVVFSFFHDPRGIGRLLNPLIKVQQRRNRLAALASLKREAERRAVTRTPSA
jgi:hypothetical protein